MTGPGPAATAAQGWRRWATPQVVLLAVAASYSLVVLTQLRWFDYLAYDEVVYASQFAHGLRPMEMTAPRAWGMPLLLAPVDVFTTSIPVLRAYLGVLAGVGLYLAFHPWLRVSARWVAPIAAALFATLWTSVLYAVMGYPNIWLGFALMAGTGWAWRVLDGDTGRRALLWLVAAFGVASMIRPTDAVIVAAPLLAALAWKRASRPLVAVAAGLSIGVGAWVVESFVRFGDPIERLRQAAENTGAAHGLGLGFIALLQAVDGTRFLCRPAARCADLHLLEVAWWLALPVLVGLGVAVAQRRSRYLLLATSAALLAASYVIPLDWSNTRFLQPAYVLLAVPIARAVLAGLQARRAIAVAVLVLVVAHTTMQLVTYRRVASNEIDNARARREEVAFLRDTVGVDPPCVVYLLSGPTVPYSIGCETGSPTSVLRWRVPRSRMTWRPASWSWSWCATRTIRRSRRKAGGWNARRGDRGRTRWSARPDRARLLDASRLMVADRPGRRGVG